MTIEFKLPELAEGVESADIAEIMVAEGNVIEAGQTVMEVETEKAVAEIDCPHAGKITKVHVSEGDTVEIGAPLLTIEETAEAEGKAEEAPEGGEGREEAKPEPEPAAEEKEPEKKEAEAEPRPEAPRPAEAEAQQPEKPVPEAEPKAEPAGTATAPTAPGELEGDGQERPPAPAAPSTRRLARELGVDLYRVPATGPGRRITTDDVKAYVRQITSRTRQQGAAERKADLSPPDLPELPDFAQFGPVEREKLTKLERTSVANLSTAWRQAPHVTQHDLADITELEAARRHYMQTIGRREPDSESPAPKVTMTAIAVKACSSLLKEFPRLNSSLDPTTDELVLKQYYHVGVAVDTPYGLVVPVVRDADQKSVLELAAELTDLADRARGRKLKMEEMRGGTFTITNLGGIGGTSFTPIVNHPEVAILGISRAQKQVTLSDGRPVERLMLPLSLSYDHRVVNGAEAARFIVRLSGLFSDYFQLLLEQ